MRTFICFLALLCILVTAPCRGEDPVRQQKPECVILLHGLMRSSGSMERLAGELHKEGFIVINQGYPSRSHPIQALSGLAIERDLNACRTAGTQRVHFVTHSLGGILVRHYLSEHTIPELGRIVMLAPPNQGSPLSDVLEEYPELEDITGPAGFQLGTDGDSVPLMLGPATYEVGIITGDATINPIVSAWLGVPNDGTVTVESARLEGMTDFLVVPHSHPYIMRSDYVIGQTIYFLYFGKFMKTVSEE
jgi:pimeloyl-ACP methyl ester carboxylesterase